jgi:hypothetical protein
MLDGPLEPDPSDVVPVSALRILRVLFALGLAAGVALFLDVAVKTLFYPHEVIVSEGAVGLAVQSIREGVPLYDPVRWTAEPFVIVHYTPLYYLTTALVGKILGPSNTTLGLFFFEGRLVSILATLATALVAGLIARRATGRIGPALVAGGLWLSFYQVVFWGTTQRVDALGILFEAIGVLVFSWTKVGGRGALATAATSGRRAAMEVAAVPWFVAAWATKQVMIAGLVAAVVALFLQYGFRRAARFALCGFGAIAVIAGSLMAASDGAFWTATVLGTVSSKADTPWVIFSNAELFFGSPWNMAMLTAATWAAWVGGAHAWRRRGTAAAGNGEAGEGGPVASLSLFLGLYLWIGLLLAIATDANLPRFFPPMLAMALLVALLLERGRCAPRLAMGLLVVLVLTGASHGLYEMRSLVRERIFNLHDDNQRLLFARALDRYIKPGDSVLAQDVGMAISAIAKPVVADPYVFSILAGNGTWRPEILDPGIRERRYAAVVLNHPLESLDPGEWTTLWIAPEKAAIMKNYRLAETVTIDQEWRFLEPTRYIYVPRERN